MLKVLTKYDYRESAIRALRLTDKKQATGCIHERDGSMCALGIIGTEVLGLQTKAGNLYFIGYNRGYEIINQKLGDGFYQTISSMNDTGQTFEEIATWIEAQP